MCYLYHKKGEVLSACDLKQPQTESIRCIDSIRKECAMFLKLGKRRKEHKCLGKYLCANNSKDSPRGEFPFAINGDSDTKKWHSI